LYFCIHNSYKIILQGLRGAYWVWISHLALLISLTICINVRPIWEPHPVNFLYDNNLICTLWGKFHAVIYSISHFLVTIFSAYKAEIYFQLVWKRKWLTHGFKILILVGVIPVVAVMILWPAGQAHKSGYRVCLKLNGAATILWKIILAHWFCVNLAMNLIFWCYQKLPDDAFPSLEHQLMINRRLIPIMFMSSLLILVAMSVAKNITRTDWLIFALQSSNLLDIFLNNVVMYYTLFGHVGFIEREIEMQRRLEYTAEMNSKQDVDVQVMIDRELGDQLQGHVYISLPGMHPIRVSLELIEEYEMHEYIITKKKILRQIKKYQKRGIIPSLCHTCNTSDELLEQIERMEREEIEDSQMPHSEPTPTASSLRVVQIQVASAFMNECDIPRRRTHLEKLVVE